MIEFLTLCITILLLILTTQLSGMRKDTQKTAQAIHNLHNSFGLFASRVETLMTKMTEHNNDGHASLAVTKENNLVITEEKSATAEAENSHLQQGTTPTRVDSTNGDRHASLAVTGENTAVTKGNTAVTGGNTAVTGDNNTVTRNNTTPTEDNNVATRNNIAVTGKKDSATAGTENSHLQQGTTPTRVDSTDGDRHASLAVTGGNTAMTGENTATHAHTPQHQAQHTQPRTPHVEHPQLQPHTQTKTQAYATQAQPTPTHVGNTDGDRHASLAVTEENTATQTHPTMPHLQIPKANMEKFIGKNLLPFLAAGMVFVGLIFLAILVVPSLSHFQRFLGMFALAGGIFAGGFALTYYKKNTFSVALLGTGIGSLFISILMTRIYFNYLGDIATFSLLLVWMAATMGLVKLFNSLTLSITAHVGMIISLIFAFAQGFDPQRALIVIAYQIVATLVIVGGSVLAYRKTYRFGLSASLAITLVATLIMQNHFHGESDFGTGTIAASYLIQFLTASALSFFLSTSVARIENTEYQTIYHVGNKSVWAIITLLTIYPAVNTLMLPAAHGDTSTGENPTNTVALVACMVVFITHAFVSAFLARTIALPNTMARISIVGAVVLAALVEMYRVAMDEFAQPSSVPFLFIFALISLAFVALLREKIYAITAIGILIFDALLAVILTFSPLSPVAVFVWIGGIVATGVLIYMTWKPAEQRRAYMPLLILAELIVFEIGIAKEIHAISEAPFAAALSLTIIFIVISVMRFINLEQLLGMSRAYYASFAINEYILAFIAIVTVTFHDETDTTASLVLFWFVTAMVFAIALVRIVQSHNINAPYPTHIQYASAATVTFAALAPLNRLVDTGEAAAFVTSVVAMLVALLLVGVGFALRLKHVRLYGLGLTIFAVLKMATYDVSNISSVGRVIAFITGGLIAFGISALYNYADKRLMQGEAGRPDALNAGHAAMPDVPTGITPAGTANFPGGVSPTQVMPTGSPNNAYSGMPTAPYTETPNATNTDTGITPPQL